MLQKETPSAGQALWRAGCALDALGTAGNEGTASLGEASRFLSGIEALTRLPLEQRRIDAAHGLNTAGFVSGYRGSPLGGLDLRLWKAAAELETQRIVFQPGLNEDLAATAVWGSQQVGLFPGARCGGVFGMWYGKAPGLDRSCDALRHANAAGTSPLGGVLLVVGDDHACKSSTLPSASEFALRDLGIPVLAPADVQDVLDLGLFGWALSRYAGCWAGLAVASDVADSAMVVRLRHRDYAMPAREEDPHIRLGDAPLAEEARLQTKQRLAARFATANGINRVVADCPQPRLVLASAGKVYADLRESLAKLGLPDTQAIADAGVRLVKLGMTWPLDAAFVKDAVRGAGRVLVVEAKRPFIEEQLKCLLYDAGDDKPAVFGKSGRGAALPAVGELDAPTIAHAVAAILGDVPNRAYLDLLARREGWRVQPAAHVRKPTYCAGCPHNLSTRVPAGSRAGAGIGCHYMAQWMDRNTHLTTHMGAEGVNWIGQAPFTAEKHLFANLGDGTYFHSGILAIRAAVAARVNITYKILFNDAVAMTGGQPVDGTLTVERIARQAQAEGVAAVEVVADDPRRHKLRGVAVHGREELDAVQRRLRETPGCTVLIYDQTCAAELRRRRKRGRGSIGGKETMRVTINDAVCEGCGDCSTQSNCVAVVPLATEFGTKRAIDQHACNQDLACLAGFCPALVAVKGTPRKPRPDIGALLKQLPAPASPTRADILLAGIGGTGIVTVSRLLGMAAHLDGKFASTVDMTGLAQKGGAVLSHVRISPRGEGHAPTRIPAASADALLAADLVTAAGDDARKALSAERTAVFANAHVAPTADFVLRGEEVPANGLRARLREAAKHVETLDATAATTALFGNAACANVLLLGFAFQHGALPVSALAVESAIGINGVAVEENLAAFQYGRAAAHDARLLPAAARRPRSPAMMPPRSRTLDERIAVRSAFLANYQDEALAACYREMVQQVEDAEARVKPGSRALAGAVAESYFTLLATKDEYEVARLFVEKGSDPLATMSFSEKLARQFEPGFSATFHLSLPWTRHGSDGRPAKTAVPAWAAQPIMRLLAKARPLRRTWLDPFRFRGERRLEQALAADYETDCETIIERLSAENLAVATDLAQWPAPIKGFGPVKERAALAARAQRHRLLQKLAAPTPRPRTPATPCHRQRAAA